MVSTLPHRGAVSITAQYTVFVDGTPPTSFQCDLVLRDKSECLVKRYHDTFSHPSSGASSASRPATQRLLRNQLANVSDDGRPKWIAPAVYGKRVGLSRTTGQMTHVTVPDVDVERNFLFDSLTKTGDLERQFIERGFHTVLEGHNGRGRPVVATVSVTQTQVGTTSRSANTSVDDTSGAPILLGSRPA